MCGTVNSGLYWQMVIMRQYVFVHLTEKCSYNVTNSVTKYFLLLLSNDPDHNKEWKYLQHPQIFDPADVINLHESNVFDMLVLVTLKMRMDTGIESISDINHEIPSLVANNK